jgi:GNAT superfamily N-acetyltransferase
MAELRPQLREAEFVDQVRKQEREGFQLAFAQDEAGVVAVAGYRFMEKLYSGKSMYVDDLVTSAADRGHGHGHALFQWLVALAREQKCRVLELDSGVQRFDAHRFYLRERMAIRSHHFALEL